MYEKNYINEFASMKFNSSNSTRQYCSPYPDTDGFFGSRGDFLKFHPLCGSIQLHPPDVEELLMDTVRHVEKLLSQTQVGSSSRCR